MKKFLSLILAVAMVLTTLAGVQIVSADSLEGNIYTVAADSYVDNSNSKVKSKNFGSAEEVSIKPKTPGYMIFDLSDLTGYSVENAVLNLYVESAPAGAELKVATITNPLYASYAHWTDAKHWTESGLNATSIGTITETNSVSHVFNSAVENKWIEIQIADLVNDEGDKIISLALTTTSTTAIVISSKEKKNGEEVAGDYAAFIKAYGELTEKPLAVEGLSLDKNSATLKAGVEKLQLNVSITPAYALNKNVIWTSTNEDVATVSSTGIVSAVSAGEEGIATCVIRAESEENSDIYDECEITVEAVGGEASSSYIIKTAYTTTYNNHWPNRDWSTETTNEVKGTGGSSRTSYARFKAPELAGYDIAFAQLTVTAASAPVTKALPITCRGFYNTDWTEMDVVTTQEKYFDENGDERTRETTELPDANLATIDCGTVDVGVKGQSYTWDVTDYVTGANGDYSFSFKTSDARDVNATLYAHGTDNEPYLVIVARPYMIDSTDLNNVKVGSKYAGNGTESQKFIVGQYDKNETMLSLKAVNIAKGSEQYMTFKPDETMNTRFYQFESLESAVPVKTSYKYRIGTTDPKAVENAPDGVSIKGTVVTVSGTAQPNENVGLTAAIPSGSLSTLGDLIYLGQTTADAKGKYTLSFNMPEDASVGMYDYAVGGSESGSLVSSQFYYASPSTPVSQVFAYIAGCDDPEEVRNVINSVASKIGLSGNKIYEYFTGLDDEKKQEVLEGIVDEADPSDNTDDLVDIMTKYIVNGSTSSELNDFIEKTADDLLPASYASKYDDLSVTEKGTVAKKARGNYESANSFINKVKSEIDDLADSGSGSSSSSGSSGKGTTYKEVASAIVNPVVTPRPTEAPYDHIFFYDLGGYEWAEDAINDLATKGVVAGDGDHHFNPANDVTREEFVKMLIIGFGLRDSSATCDFDDVSESDWYYEFVAAANKLGIVKGMSDTEFGVGLKITRQDMAVMVYRAATVAGKTLADGEINFTDNDLIADYAKAAVGSMQASGVITGMGDGSFAPLSNANRAQSAVIISRILGK